MEKYLKISFCTSAMNRLEHLKETLIKNIEDNISYPNMEFVLLNYNTSDGMDEWISTSLGQYLDSGILKYYKTEEPEYFNRSHSRNVMFKLASGDILCNVDADNFIGVGFAHFINETFRANGDIFMTPPYSKRDVIGRVCMRKIDFLDINGYDESMKGYGFEDLDFYERLKKKGLTQHTFDDDSFLKYISHSHTERFNNDYLGKKLHSILVSYINPNETKAIYLLTDSTYHDAYFVDKELSELKRQIEFKSDPASGKWFSNESGLVLVGNRVRENLLATNESGIYKGDSDGSLYYTVGRGRLTQELILLKTEVENRKKYERHISNPYDYIAVNPNGFGLGEVKHMYAN